MEEDRTKTGPADGSRYAFADFELDIGRGTLKRHGVDIKLRPKSYELLCVLVRRHGQLISKQEILDAVWPNAAVSDDTITQSILDIRRALADTRQSLVETVPRRGYRLSQPVTVLDDTPPRDAARGAATGPGRLRLFAALAVVALLAALWGANRWDSSSLHEPSIAVMPFLDLTAEQDLEYFADGMSEEILNSLAQIPELRVIARTSSFYFKDQPVDIATIGEQLDVSYVLEGSVRRSDDVLRITAQLISVDTEEHVWSQTYDRAMGDVFAVQGEVSASVLNLFLSSIDRQLDPERPVDSRVYRLYLQARVLIDKGDDSVDDDAERLLRQALEIDGTYGPAWRDLARLHWRAIGKGATLADDIRRTRDTLDMALRFAPNDAGVIAYDAWHNADFHGDFSSAAVGLERAMQVSPTHEDALRVAMLFAHAIDDFEDAVPLGEYAIDRNPMCQMCLYNLAGLYLDAGMVAESIATVRRFQALFPGGHGQLAISLLFDGRPEEARQSFSRSSPQSWRWWGEALTLHDLGRDTEARKAYEALLALPEDRRTLRLVTTMHAWFGEHDLAFVALRRYIALLQKRVAADATHANIMVGQLLRSPFFADLRDDPRWQELLADIAFTDKDLASARARILAPPEWTRSALVETMLREGGAK